MIALAALLISNLAFAQIPESPIPPESIIESISKDLVVHTSIPGMYDRNQYDVNIQDDGKVVGFTVRNEGTNRIIPKKAGIGEGPERDFAFDMPDRARQDLLLRVTDVPSDKLSEMMESYFMIFPRLVVPAIQVKENKITITLPNREEIILDATSKEIIDGVFKEGSPIDLGPDRFKRKFADLTYTGKGLVLRADLRGEDPRLGVRNAIAFYQGKKCKIPVSQLWDQSDDVHFKFPTDLEFQEFIKKACKFDLIF